MKEFRKVYWIQLKHYEKLKNEKSFKSKIYTDYLVQENTPQLSDKEDSILVLRFGELLYLVTQVFNFLY